MSTFVLSQCNSSSFWSNITNNRKLIILFHLLLLQSATNNPTQYDCFSNLTMLKDEYRQSTYSLSPDKVAPLPRNKKTPAYIPSGGTTATNRTTVPMPPPRRANSQQRFVFYNHHTPNLSFVENCVWFFIFLCFMSHSIPFSSFSLSMFILTVFLNLSQPFLPIFFIILIFNF